jgi:hypothetical protein
MALYLISRISSFRRAVRVLQSKILLPSTINISSLWVCEQENNETNVKQSHEIYENRDISLDKPEND